MSFSTAIMIVAILFFVIIPSFKDRFVPIHKLIISPIIFLSLFYSHIKNDFYIDQTSILLIMTGMLLGIFMGMGIRYRTKIRVEKDKKLIWLPGTYANFFIFLCIFSVYFVIGYLQSVHPTIFSQTNVSQYALLFALALTSSLTIGMSSCLYYKYLIA